jgi:hypothetical protein
MCESISIDDLKKLNGLIKEVEELKKEIEYLKLKSLPLDTKNRVALYFDKSTSTINKWIQQGKLVEGVHFNRNDANMLVFIEDEVLKYAKTRNRNRQ